MNATFPSARLAAFGLVLAITGAARADVLKVPSAQFPTVQSAVAASSAFDTIKIAAGTYVESVSVQSKTDLTIVGSGVVLIDDAGTSTAMWVMNCQRVRIEKLHFHTGAGFAGILVDSSSDVTVSRCEVKQSANAGIWVSSSTRVRVEKSRVQDVTGSAILCGFFTFGIQPAFGASDSTFIHNVIENCGGTGIDCGNTGNVIKDNRIRNTGAEAIVVRTGASDCTIVDNDLRDVGTGIQLAGVNLVVKKNSIKRPTGDGYQINCDDSTIGKCMVKRAGGDGFSFESGASGNHVSKCSSKRAGADGFHVVGTGSDFTKCVAKKSAGLDLDDPAGGATTNVYAKCTFGTTNLP